MISLSIFTTGSIYKNAWYMHVLPVIVRRRPCRFVALLFVITIAVLSLYTGRYLFWQSYITDVEPHQIRRIHVANIEKNETYADYAGDLSIEGGTGQPFGSDNVLFSSSDAQATGTTGSRRNFTTQTVAVYKFPNKPLHNIHSILNQSIGINILRDPKKNPLRNCSPTVQFQVRAVPSTADSTGSTNDSVEYIIQSMMLKPENNYTENSKDEQKLPVGITPKLYGGDEIFVEWVSNDDTEMGVAMITDHMNGTYTCKFIRPPLLQHNYTTTFRKTSRNDYDQQQQQQQPEVYGRLTIYYDYTCGIGNIYAPLKNQYRRAGEIHLSFTNDNVPTPYIHPFIPPNTNLDPTNSKIDLSKYGTVITFGDSLISQMARRYTLGGFWSPNIIYRNNINQCISNDSDVETALQKFTDWHHEVITKTNHSIAVITGSAVWDAMRGCVRSDFKDHRAAIRKFISTIKEAYPNVDLYWKSPSAIALHRRNSLEDLMKDKVWMQRSRYMSDAIPRAMYVVQKKLMQELGTSFLDLYDAYYLSATWSRPGDSRHYNDEISSLLLSYYWPGLNRTLVYYH